MSRVLALVAPSADDGAPVRRRAAALATACRDAGWEVAPLVLESAPPGASEILRRTAELGARPAIAPPDAVAAALRWLHARRGLRLVVAAAGAPTVIDAPAPLVVDAPDPEESEPADGPPPALCICCGSGGAARWGGPSVAALLPPAGPRPSRPHRTPGAPLIAGLWTGAAGEDIAAAAAFLAAFADRGGGDPPRILLGGPGASSVTTPSTPYPPTIAPAETDEATFLRAVDLSLHPGPPGGGAPIAAFDALAAGAAPLILANARGAAAEIWRLPVFEGVEAMVEHLYERGGDLRAGGLWAEMRARIDWTWSGLQIRAAAEKRALAAALEAAAADRREADA